MKIIIILNTIVSLNLVFGNERQTHEAVDCSMGSSSCESCHAAYPFCYWCDGTCRRYYGKRIASIQCTGKMLYESCEDSNASKGTSKAEEILELLAALKKQRSKQRGFEYFGEPETKPPPIKSVTNKAKLAHLLKLLKMLSFLKEGKTKTHQTVKGKLTQEKSKAIDKNEFELEEIGKQNIESERLKSEKHVSSTSDLDSLLNMVSKVKSTNAPQKKTIEKNISLEKQKNADKKITGKRKTAIITSPVPSNLDHSTAAQPKTTKIKLNLATNGTETPLKTARAGQYCQLFEQEDECNSDKDCSWCNILDECVGRNKEDFRYCAGDKRSSDVDQQGDPEMCTAMKSCSSCTKKGKCFWCEKTKSCHTYPFFGYIPHNCPANMWYYKECDVQLAIFIILFPLLMILLCMVVFYFCLRFCYYRKKMLKVQLFEKPELFEKRKGKKVYFVGGDEEDDEETRSEQIRKKYNLPHEKEPLISP